MKQTVNAGVKVARVSTLCVTDLSPSAVGGLPGYMLTAADAGLKSLRLCGPTGLQAVLASTRHFMRRDDLSVAVEEAAPSAAAAPCLGAAGGDRAQRTHPDKRAPRAIETPGSNQEESLGHTPSCAST